MRFFALLFGLFAGTIADAAQFSVLALGGYVRSDVEIAPIESHTPLLRPSGAFLLGPKWGPFEIQTGAYYMPVGIGQDLGAVKSQSWTQYVQIPLLFRLSSRQLSFAAGGYYGHPLNAQSVSSGSWVSVSVPSDQTMKADRGVMGALGLRFPIDRSVLFSLEGVYQHGLISISRSGSEAKTRNIAAMAGFGFHF